MIKRIRRWLRHRALERDMRDAIDLHLRMMLRELETWKPLIRREERSCSKD